MKHLRSIRVRLLGLIGLLLLVVLGGFGYVAWRRESAAHMAAVDRALEERLNILLGGLRPGIGAADETGGPRLSQRARELFANEGGEPFYYRVWLVNGQVQWRSDHAPEIPLPTRTPGARSFRTRGDARELFHFAPSGRCFLVGRSIRPDRAAMQADAVSLAAVGAGVLALGIGIAWWIASRVTRPLAQVSHTAKQIAAGDLSQRIKLTETEDELGDVAKVLNETFTRLEDAFARQKQFTADASHELRTPVSLILAHAQGALLHEQSPDEYREALTDCANAAQRMKALIESLLDLARCDGHAEPIQREPCDLAALARECTALLRPLADAKRLRLDLDLQPAPCHGDAMRLSQVITNLLTNAIHFTPAEGAITLRTNQDGSACLSISDTGPGIASDQLPHIFERFRRADASRTRATGGTGLGLAICKAIVEAHGGSIAVETEVAKGSTSTVLLPPTPH